MEVPTEVCWCSCNWQTNRQTDRHTVEWIGAMSTHGRVDEDRGNSDLKTSTALVQWVAMQ